MESFTSKVNISPWQNQDGGIVGAFLYSVLQIAESVEMKIFSIEVQTFIRK